MPEDDLVQVLAQFHREVFLPDLQHMIEGVLGNAFGTLSNEMHVLFDDLYIRFDQHYSELQSINAVLGRINSRP